MFSFFSRDPAANFNCEIGEELPGVANKTIWKLHKGKKKATGEEVSVFAFDVKGASESQHEVAKAAFKRMKTLRHPNFLIYQDGLESDKVLYVVTEPVVPLCTYLKELNVSQTKSDVKSSRNFEISWGIHQITKGLIFLMKDCKLSHNNICLSSIYVNRAGEWLVGGTEFTNNHGSSYPIKILPELEKYNPPEKSANRQTNEWATDMWGLGCLIWEVFNGALNKTSDLKSIGKLPSTISGLYATLVSANPRSRPNPLQFISDCQRSGGFMNNKFIETMIFLDEIQIKDPRQKVEFLESLNSEIENFPENFSKHKVLPELIQAFEFGDAGANVLTPLLKVGKLLDSEEYQKRVVPCIVKMFSSTDRQMRVKLLQQIYLYIEHIPINTINEQIYTNVSLGFNDTNPLVRETTIKAMLHMASRLNYKNINEDLMRHFAKLQAKDDQGGIRTNTTVCLGKIAGYLNPQIRQKVLISAYTRAIRDPFPPARQAALLAITASIPYFPTQEIAVKVLPSLCSLTRDPDKSVRDQTFKTIESLLDYLKQVSDDPELLEKHEQQTNVTTTGHGQQSQSWTGWAVTAGVSSLTSLSSLTSKFTTNQKSAVKSTNHTSEKSNNQTSDKSTNQTSDKSTIDQSDRGTAAVERMSAQPEVQVADSGWDDGWNEDSGWDDFGDKPAESKKERFGVAEAGGSSADGWDDWGGDEEFEPIESSAKTSSYNWDSHSTNQTTASKKSANRKSDNKKSTNQKEDNFFDAISTNKVDDSPVEGSTGWDADTNVNWLSADQERWGDDNWGIESSNTKPESPVSKAERDEKRALRKKQLAEKREGKTATKKPGGLKLGAKKLAVD